MFRMKNTVFSRPYIVTVFCHVERIVLAACQTVSDTENDKKRVKYQTISIHCVASLTL